MSETQQSLAERLLAQECYACQIQHDKVGVCTCDDGKTRREAATELERLDKWRLYVENRTPQGSEYHNDLERCSQFIDQVFADMHQAKKVRELQRRRITDLEAIVAKLPVFGCGAHPLRSDGAIFIDEGEDGIVESSEWLLSLPTTEGGSEWWTVHYTLDDGTTHVAMCSDCYFDSAAESAARGDGGK